MLTFTLCIIVASAATVLAGPPGQSEPGVKILKTFHGKRAITAFINQHPSVSYQLLGPPDPAFPRSTTGQPGKLKVLKVIRGAEAIANFATGSHVKIRVPEEAPRTRATSHAFSPTRWPNRNSASNPRSAAPQPRLTREQQQQLDLWNRGLGNPPDWIVQD